MKIRRMNNNILEICDENNEVILSFTEQFIEGEINISISGKITNEVAHDFEDEVMAAFTVCKNIVLDFSNVTYIASFALKALLSIQQMIDEDEKSRMILTNVSEEVMGILKESGFSEILNIQE